MSYVDMRVPSGEAESIRHLQIACWRQGVSVQSGKRFTGERFMCGLTPSIRLIYETHTMGGVLFLPSFPHDMLADMATDTPTQKLRWFQFSLRTLLVFVTLCVLACSWLAVKMERARKQRAIVDEIRKLGGQVEYKGSLLGEDFFAKVVAVRLPPPLSDGNLEHLRKHLEGLTQLRELSLHDTQLSDAGLQHLKGLTQLKRLDLINTQVSDAGLEHLKGLTKLKWLDFNNTQVTDAGLEHLKGLTKLESLDFSNTQVTDAGLEHLKGLKQLELLSLTETKITDGGLERLKGLKKLWLLNLGGTQLTDAGLEHLKGLMNLHYLDLEDTQVTDAGLQHLKGPTNLTGLDLMSTQVTDGGLEHLKELTQLQSLYLKRTQVTEEGVKKLQQALPKCQISH